MKFLDRTAELDRLDGLVKRRTAGLAALWGRRRVGKSRLLMEWSAKNGGVYTVADVSAAAVQRRYFADAVSAKLTGFNDVEYPDWGSLLRRLSSDARACGWKGPLILDEFPYLVMGTPSLPSVFQNWVDRERETDGLLAVIAGSSQRMMQGFVLDASAPLYGRASEAFTLRPLPPGWLAEALGGHDPVAVIEAYSVWGGIPRYWELAQPFGMALDDAVDALVLDPMGPLHTEPDRLLLEETPSALSLRPLLDVIGGGSNRVSEMAGRLGCPVTSLARPLARLQELGIVVRETPFGESEKTCKRALYKISDPFFAFWFRVVASRRGFLAGASRHARLAVWHSFKQEIVSRVWEDLCRRAAPILAAEKMGNGAWQPAARWWQANLPEWDIVSASVDGRCGLVGEAKWSAKPFGENDVCGTGTRLVSRALPFGGPDRVERWVFVPSAPKIGRRKADGWSVVDAAAVLSCLR